MAGLVIFKIILGQELSQDALGNFVQSVEDIGAVDAVPGITRHPATGHLEQEIHRRDRGDLVSGQVSLIVEQRPRYDSNLLHNSLQIRLLRIIG